jgi:hypothetical protein
VIELQGGTTVTTDQYLTKFKLIFLSSYTFKKKKIYQNELSDTTTRFKVGYDFLADIHHTVMSYHRDSSKYRMFSMKNFAISVALFLQLFPASKPGKEKSSFVVTDKKQHKISVLPWLMI